MDAASFERVYDSLQEFHAFFAASFGRKQWRDHSGNQDQERRNAENLSESVGISARAMQRFLTEARWSDETVIGRLQEYLAPRLGHPEAVWVFDGSDFPKQGRKSAGVARQYCGRLGKVANCQGGMFLAYVSPLGRALVDKRLYLPKSWTSDQDRCARTGGTTGQRRSWPWRCWSGSWSWATSGRVGCRRRRLRDVADLPGTGPWGRAGRSGRIRILGFGNPGFGRPHGGPWRMKTGDNWPREARGRAPTGSAQRVRGPNSNCPRERLWPTWVGPGGALKRSSREG